ncbi:MAG: DNA mismatch repair endonuclease MutL [Saccharofermentanales bacterium]
MATIKRLDTQTINSIAAGEVVERPASVAKELIDNALDAGASILRLSFENGGIKSLTCADDGFGMSAEDARLSLLSHATSKLTTTEDLQTIDTMGFRGEALPSVAAVSRMELKTRRAEDREGIRLLVEGGEVLSEAPCGMAPGTIVAVHDLFFNTPARYKFLKSDTAEAGALADMVGKVALTRPDVSFHLERLDKGEEVLYTPGDNDLLSAIYAVFGKDTAQGMVPVEAMPTPPVRVAGYVTTPECSRHNRSRQIFIVNGRVIQSATLRAAADEASKTWFMKGRFPQLVVTLDIPKNLLDVNVHPQKAEMRFWDERAVFRAVYQALRATFERTGKVFDTTLTAPLTSAPAPNAPRSTDAAPGAYERVNMTFPTVTVGESAAAAPRTDDRPEEGERSTPVGAPAADDAKLPPQRDDSDGGWIRSLDDERRSLLEARIIGTLFSTYVLIEDGDAFILIDQHAAHERILYESLLARRRERSHATPPRQQLLVPTRVTVTAAERALLEEAADALEAMGFVYEPFGGDSVALRAVPMSGRGAAMDPVRAFQAAVDTLRTARERGHDIDDTEIYHDIACKAAIKAHDRLSYDEAKLLIERLVRVANPFHCPHGRPVAIRITQTELEKRFGRIV